MVDYSKKKYQELQTIAKEKGLTVFGVKKQDLIKLLTEHDEAGSEDIPELESDNFKPEEVEAVAVETVDEIRGEEDTPKSTPVEPKVLAPSPTGEVSQVKTSGGAPDDLLLEHYLIERGLTFSELNQAVSVYLDKTNPNRNVTMESLESKENSAKKKAKSIDDNLDIDEYETNDSMLANALHNSFGWKSVGRKRNTFQLKRH